jgi:hypothetical protein
MRHQAVQLNEIIEAVFARADRSDLSRWSLRPAPGKWSKNEILGHLIDSAINNITRFVRGTHEEGFKVVYHQDEWVSAQRCQDADTRELLTLWRQLNRQIARILDRYPEERKQVVCDTGKEQVSLHSMAFLAQDYIDHLQHHLGQLETE